MNGAEAGETCGQCRNGMNPGAVKCGHCGARRVEANPRRAAGLLVALGGLATICYARGWLYPARFQHWAEVALGGLVLLAIGVLLAWRGKIVVSYWDHGR